MRIGYVGNYVQPGPRNEQERLTTYLPPRHNTYRPQAPDFLQKPTDMVGNLTLQYAPSRMEEMLRDRSSSWIVEPPRGSSRCRNPATDPFNTISNVFMNHGFGPYRSETQEQFDQPTAQAFGRECYYETPSGYSTARGTHQLGGGFWDPSPPACKDDPRQRVTTPPTRHNPWPRINMGFDALLNPDYRPDPDNDKFDYACVSVMRHNNPKSFEARDMYY